MMIKKSYLPALQLILTGQIDLTIVGRMKAYLIDSSFYTFLNTHSFLSSVPTSARIGTTGVSPPAPQTVTGVTVSSAGVVDLDDLTFSPVTGPPVDAILYVFQAATPADATTLLLWYEYSTSGALTPTLTASTVTVQIDSGAKRFGLIRDLVA